MDESRAEHVQQVLSAARATLARSGANGEQFREQSVDAPGAPGRSRGRPLAPRDRTPPPPAPQPSRLDIQTPTWADERASVLEAIQTWADEREVILEVVRGLRELCEKNVGNQLAELRWRQLGTPFDTPQAAFSELKQWANAEAPLCDAKESPASAGLSLGVPPSQRCALQPSME
jgi:hypothetical protein